MITSLKSPHGRKLSLAKPVFMGVLNITPDSFYDGGKFFAGKSRVVLEQARTLVENGARILDIGGESTGPGSKNVQSQEELRRVLPMIKLLRRNKQFSKIWISIDTYKSEVARKAIEAGADMMNDVTALRGDAGMAKTAAKLKTPIILMYAKDATPRTTRKKIRYQNVVRTVKDFLESRARFARAQGVKKSSIILDPGMGAFVSGIPKYSFEILRRLPEIKKLGFPICVGPSMKSFLGGKLEDRKIPSFFAGWYAAQNGASIIRLHDLNPNCAAV